MVTKKKKIKIIIFGASGSIGSYLAKEYISQNYEVLLLAKSNDWFIVLLYIVLEVVRVRDFFISSIEDTNLAMHSFTDCAQYTLKNYTALETYLLCLM